MAHGARARRALLFLMPLMLQHGFGLMPLQSGSVTFEEAIAENN
ncbi:hypothetical protein [Rhizobium leguminosarum]|nr:hypothetical protein [Rhizobium leguminosarum]